jgi:leucine-rich repeat protein SHOC2
MSKADNVWQRVLELIEQARSQGSKELNLSTYLLRGELQELPDEVFGLVQLERLFLSGNNLRRVPERIRELTNLKHLDLSDNPLEEVPDIAGLELDWDSYLRCKGTLSTQNVEGINIKVNVGKGLPSEAAKGVKFWNELILLPRLSRLNILATTDNFGETVEPPDAIRELLDNIGDLQSIEALYISRFSLGGVPGGIRHLKKLHTFGFCFAKLRAVPDWLGELSQIKNLILY